MLEPPHMRSKVCMSIGGDRQSVIEFHLRNFLKQATSISAQFNLHARVRQEQHIRGLCRKTGSRMLRYWGQSGNEEKRKNPEFRGNPVVHLLRTCHSVSAYLYVHRANSIHTYRNSFYDRSTAHGGITPSAESSG